MGGQFQSMVHEGCNMPKKNLRGQRFGRLIAKRALNTRISGAIVWRCKCDCGNYTLCSSSSLLCGHVRSCGCLHDEVAAQLINKNRPPRSPMYKHGGSSDPKLMPTYRTWQGMLARCFNKNATNYKSYGRVGVTVCERWRGPKGFQNFVHDMGTRPFGKSLGRCMDVGPYEKSNCSWQTWAQQQEHKRLKRRFIKYSLEQALTIGPYSPQRKRKK
jgi:hypothetical protein